MSDPSYIGWCPKCAAPRRANDPGLYGEDECFECGTEVLDLEEAVTLFHRALLRAMESRERYDWTDPLVQDILGLLGLFDLEDKG